MVHDAIIIGAGPAGSVAAILLARAGWSVAIVEKSVFPRRKVCGEYLSPTNHPLFAALGLADAITSAAGPPIRRMGLYARDATLTAPAGLRRPTRPGRRR
jgi:2-polyprenyl-6-methoxyphenol hydroxylase-like FAD-dependent oxidoreductase